MSKPTIQCIRSVELRLSRSHPNRSSDLVPPGCTGTPVAFDRDDAPAVEALAALVHDLRTPLTSIRGHTQILRRTLTRSETAPLWVDGGLAEIEAATTRMAGLLDELVDTARWRADLGPSSGSWATDLVALSRRVVADAGATSPGHRVQLRTTESGVVGPWDSTQIRRVVENLVGNAIKYSPKGGAIVVAVTREATTATTWAIMSVHDHGLGIPAADLSRIFEPFHRGSNVGGIDGSGLGLASARLIVQQYGGNITAKSRVGHGTTFTVCLPLARR